MSTVAHFTLAEYDRMVAAGVFDEPASRRLELIRGEIREMNPIGPFHEDVVDRLNRWSTRVVPEEEVRVRIQNSVGLIDVGSAPQPDMVWVAERDYSGSRPTSRDVLLLIEVADSSLDYDRGEKAELCAEAGILDYWVANLVDRVVEVRRDPARGRYQSLRVYAGHDEVRPLAKPQIVLRPRVLWP